MDAAGEAQRQALLDRIEDLEHQLLMCKKANAEAEETVKALLRDKLVLQEQLMRKKR